MNEGLSDSGTDGSSNLCRRRLSSREEAQAQRISAVDVVLPAFDQLEVKIDIAGRCDVCVSRSCMDNLSVTELHGHARRPTVEQSPECQQQPSDNSVRVVGISE